jgi:hypothetical protein
MSGTNIRNHTGPEHALFNRLISEKSGAFVLKDGKIESSGSMSFRSGLHRTFGQEKSTEDIKSNQDTMRYLLKHISEHVTDSEMQQIMNSKTRLGGDKEGYTVQQRLERGTYVSSELVGQLRLIAGRVRQETIRQQELKQPEVEDPKPNEQEDIGDIPNLDGGVPDPKLEESIKKEEPIKQEEIGVVNPGTLMTQSEKDLVVRRNFSGIENAFGGARHPESRRDMEHQWRTGGTVVDRALTKFGTEETGGKLTTFQKAINDLYQEGTSGPHPQTEVWNTFREFWTKEWKPEGEWTTDVSPKDQERHDLITQFREVVEAKVQEFTDKGIKVTQDQIKDMLKESLGSPEQMDKFENLTKTKIEQEEAEIALRVAEEIRTSNESLVRDIGPQDLGEVIEDWIKANPQFETQGKELMRELSWARELTETLDLTPQETDAMAKMIGQDGGGGHPLQLTQQLREALQTAYEADPSRTHLSSEDVSRLLGDTLTRIVTERDIGKPSPEVEAKLNEDLEDLYPTLGEMRGPQGITGGTVAGVAGGLLYQRMGEILLGRAIEQAKSEGKDLSLPETQDEITESVRQTLTQHREAQARLLPVLDQHVSLRDEIESLREGDGGLPGVSRERLRELDLRNDTVMRQSEELDAYCKQLKEEFGDDVDLGNIVDSLTGGTTMMQLESQTYMGESRRTDREYIAKVEEQLGRMGLSSDRPPPLDGVSSGLNREIRMFNGLRSFVFDLARTQENFERVESLSQLLRRTVYDSMQQTIEKNILDKAFIARFARGEVREAQQKFEQQWLDTIETRIPQLGEFRPVPPPPTPPMTVESIEKYRQDLTDYIETAKDVKEQLQVLGGALGELGRTEAEAMFEAVRNVDSYIAFAGRALQTLER